MRYVSRIPLVNKKKLTSLFRITGKGGFLFYDLGKEFELQYEEQQVTEVVVDRTDSYPFDLTGFDEEKAFAQAIVDGYEMPSHELPGSACDEDDEIAEWVAEVSKNATIPLNDFLVPYHFSTKQRAGSTDVGDVSWLVPTAQINVVTAPSNVPGHSWQNTSCGKTSIGHKGLLCAGKVLAATAIDLYNSPEKIAEAKEEWNKRAAGGYFCPVPADAVPVAIGEQMD